MGHVFKSRSIHNIKQETILANKKRVSDVWMDEFKQQFYKRTPAVKKVQSFKTKNSCPVLGTVYKLKYSSLKNN